MEKQNMYVTIGEKTYLLSKEVIPDDAMRKAFDKLAEKTFHLSFEAWYQSGYWSSSNMPYTLFDGGNAAARKLDVGSRRDLELLKSHYENRNPFSKLQTVKNFGLLMFYVGSVMKDCIFYVPEYDAVVLAEQNGTVMTCYDIFCRETSDFIGILEAIAGEETEYAALKFTPKDGYGFGAALLRDDDALFVLRGKENIFGREPLFFPEISHT